MAETTTTMSLPLLRLATIRSATRLIRSASLTEEPPYFCTTKATATTLLLLSFPGKRDQRVPTGEADRAVPGQNEAVRTTGSAVKTPPRSTKVGGARRGSTTDAIPPGAASRATPPPAAAPESVQPSGGGNRPVVGALVGVLAGVAVLLAGCGDGDPPPVEPPATSPPPVTGAAVRAELAARAAAASDLVGVRLYRVSSPDLPDREMVVVRAADGSWRVDLTGGAWSGTLDIAMIGIGGQLYHCTLPTPP